MTDVTVLAKKGGGGGDDTGVGRVLNASWAAQRGRRWGAPKKKERGKRPEKRAPGRVSM